ncbi:E3 ubiquitin-protein ligase COP1-like [Hydractinia symbiolongicarpus]|uniref:E3 ubiquitin-protein ligase COP1-like n=1 Tax=Hydractinia symbiolongicarpus TaxID=13093 RepID=UPI00254C196C|nr:E3 ubiquitin-protein ligase COP1-like [Hydractinia symbiolongicarpus]
MSSSSSRSTSSVATTVSPIVLSGSLPSATATAILNTVTSINSASNSSFKGIPRKGKKRPQDHPVIYSSIPNTFVDKTNDFICPICINMIEEAYVTKCGHSFCYKCIRRIIDESSSCPKCQTYLERKDHIFPNFHLNDLILKHKQGSVFSKRRKADTSVHTNEVHDLVNTENLELSEVNDLLQALQRKKETLEADSKAAQLEILKDFLLQIKRTKQQELDALTAEVRFLDDDLSHVESKINAHCTENQNLIQTHVVPTTPTIVPFNMSKGTCFPLDDASEQEDNCHDGFNSTRHANFRHGWSTASLAARRKRIYQHFDDLQACYFNAKKGNIAGDVKTEDSLEYITESLAKFTQFSSCRPLATLNYASDICNGSSIVSSIEFDRDCEYFAIAGVTKKIKVFEYGQVVRDVVDIHYPAHEMTCNSKISCISWSQYHKGMLASSDYEGTVTIWDAFTGTQSQLFQEHEKRCWSVDFNTVDPNLIASGSDDAKVKLWSTNMEHSVATLEAKANVCCVKFNPSSHYNIAFGSADHCVHYYDLRNPKRSLAVLKGHRKAVSYAKFVDSQQIVSASTDSQLKLWDIKTSQCLRTYKGHSNEKNFVGLATNGDYIACGSENNSLYVYYKGVSKQLLTFKFDAVRGVLDKDKKEEESNEFVSAVCWKPDSNVVVAANSQGQIKVLDLV